jgi:hypothetical protein
MLIKVKDIDLILIKFNKIGSEKCLECFCILLTDVRERMAKCTSEVCIPAVHVKGDGDRDISIKRAMFPVNLEQQIVHQTKNITWKRNITSK